MSACEEMICIEGDCIRQNRGAAGAPKGRKDSARGFNPGCNVLTGRALKGHQMELEWSNPRNISVRKEMVRSGATFRAHPFTTDNPGLKPRAESYRLRGSPDLVVTTSIRPCVNTIPLLHHSITPSLHHSITPSLHHSITPSLHHSTTPPLHHSTTPLLRAPRSSTSTTPLIP
jgi:hypothetical protein